jgi:hypothetical protein
VEVSPTAFMLASWQLRGFGHEAAIGKQLVGSWLPLHDFSHNLGRHFYMVFTCHSWKTPKIIFYQLG